MPKHIIPLSDLEIGQRAIITKIKFKGATRQRLVAMGFVKGETIFVQKVAPLGDPVDYLIKNYHISLRKDDASNILVEREEEG
jgi:Fe2+ transport system protein FeoA